MKKITIKNLKGIQTHGTEMPDPTEWIAEGVKANWWGLPERWVLHKDEGGFYDDADVIGEEMQVVEPGIPFVPGKPAVYEAGILIAEAVPAQQEVPPVLKKFAKLRAEYTIEIEDITDELEREEMNAKALKFLADTDWLIIREMDSGVPCPPEVKVARQAAREVIQK